MSLQSWQEEVVKAALKGTNTIVIQSTGNGKSLCYQFLPFVTGGTAVVTSPTLSTCEAMCEVYCYYIPTLYAQLGTTHQYQQQ